MRGVFVRRIDPVVSAVFFGRSVRNMQGRPAPATSTEAPRFPEGIKMQLRDRFASVIVLTTALLACPTIVSAGAPSPGCLGDVVPNGAVNVDDLLAVINRWGQTWMTHEITVGATVTFTPSAVNAKSGDSVRWTRQSGHHTTTSGANCTGDGIFHAPLELETPEFTFQTPTDFVGSIPFFCTPHCTFGMTGNITVGPFWEDVTANGVVNVDDLLGVINGWGPCS
jgi:plastocyanin